MQVDPQPQASQNKHKDLFASQAPNKDFYNSSILRPNALSEICMDLSSTEALDINVEKFLAEIADNFMESVVDTASQIAKHKKSDIVAIQDLAISMDKNFEIYEPSKYTAPISKLKSNEIKNISTADHKKRMELTREETKNINF